MRALKIFICILGIAFTSFALYITCNYYDYTNDEYVFLRDDYKTRMKAKLKNPDDREYAPKIWFDVLFNVKYQMYNLVFYFATFCFISSFIIVLAIMTRFFKDPIYLALMQYEDIISFISASVILSFIGCGMAVYIYNHNFLNNNAVYQYQNAIVETVK